MIVIFPTFIAPWFNKFEPLKEGEFRKDPGSGGSGWLQDERNFFHGRLQTLGAFERLFHRNRQVQAHRLFDTLLEQMSMEQGLAVLAHEMGHYKMKHIQRMLIVQTVFLLVGLYVLSLLLDYAPLYSASASRRAYHAALVLFSLLSGAVTFYLGPLMNLLSRKHEYEADRFAALTLRDGKPMEEALINLTVKNLSNLTPHPWYSAYHYSHPTPVERISAIRQRRCINSTKLFIEVRKEMVGASGFEPPTSRSRTVRSTKLSHAPIGTN